MRRAFLTLLACLGALLAQPVAASAAAGNPNPPPELYHTGKESPFNIYVAKGGHAHIVFTDAFQAKLDKAGVTARYLHPWTNLPGKPATGGFAMPVGSRYDAITLDGRFTYPGGFVFTLKGQDGKTHTLSANGASLRIFPFVAGFYVAPWVDDQQVGKDDKLLAASFAEALTVGGFFAYHPEEDSWGPTQVTLTASPKLASIVQSFGIPVKAGEVVGHITVRWNDRPEWVDDPATKPARLSQG